MNSILIVDEKNIKLLLAYISKYKKEEYSFVNNKFSTSEIKTNSSNFIIFDITLPEMNGLRFLEIFPSDKDNFQLLNSFSDRLVKENPHLSNYANL